MRSRLTAIVIASAIMIGAGVVIGGGDPSLANLWVDTNGGTCTRSSSAVAYVDAAACSTMDAAYDAAQFGDTVNLTCASGSSCSLSSQTITENVTLASTTDQPDVTFRPDPSKTIEVNGIRLGTGDGTGGEDGPDNITLKDLNAPQSGANTCSFSAWSESYYITFDNVDVCMFKINQVQHFTLRDSDIGPCNLTTQTPNLGGICHPHVEGGNVYINQDILIEDNAFHDITRNSSGDHEECLLFGSSGIDTIIRRNTFIGCAVYDLAIYNESSQANTAPLLVENNFFARSYDIGTNYAPAGFLVVALGYDAGAGADPVNNTTFRNNVFMEGGMTWNVGGSSTAGYNNNVSTGNIGAQDCPSAGSGTIYSYNLSTGTACTGTGNTGSVVLSDLLVNATDGSVDFHLKGAKGSTAADDKVPTSAGCPSNDFAGTTRPIDTNCDAGAYER